MTNLEMLKEVKNLLGITHSYQDSLLTGYIQEVKNYLLDSGVDVGIVNSDAAIGVIARGVTDLWNFGAGEGKLSTYFFQRAIQLKSGSSGGSSSGGGGGTTGVDGKSAYEIAVEYGFEGSEEEWLESLHGADGKDGKDGVDGTNGKDGKDGEDGADGKSAYQIALDNGFEGTEEAWLASLHGADGKDGTNGVDGKDGTNGTDGKDGADGYTPVLGVDYYTEAQKQELILEIKTLVLNDVDATLDEINGEVI